MKGERERVLVWASISINQSWTRSNGQVIKLKNIINYRNVLLVIINGIFR